MSKSRHLLDEDASFLLQVWLFPGTQSAQDNPMLEHWCHSGEEKQDMATKPEELRVVTSAEETHVHI